jgi:hypothetical protein
MTTRSGYWRGALCLWLLGLAMPVRAQVAQIPIQGFNGIIALPSTIDKFYSDVPKILTKTSDGVEKLVPNGKHTPDGDRSLGHLAPGTSVVVRYTVKGIPSSSDETDRSATAASLKPNEGTITSVDQSKKRITVQFANGSTETFHSGHVAEESGYASNRSRVIVYSSNASGQRVAHFFKPAKH